MVTTKMWDTETATRKLGPFNDNGPDKGVCLTCEIPLWSCWNHQCSNPEHDVRKTNNNLPYHAHEHWDLALGTRAEQESGL